MRRKPAIVCSLLIALQMVLSTITLPVFAEEVVEQYEEPQSPSVTYNMNMDWKFRKADSAKKFPLKDATEAIAKNGKNFYDVDYDDSDWEDVSVPHPVNAEDSFDNLGVDAGEGGLYRGFMFYRKHVTVPESDRGKKLFLEFEAVRQSVYLYVNGHMVGFYEAGISAMGFDITDYVNYGEDNIIAVATDNADSRGQADEVIVNGVKKKIITYETRYGHEPGDTSGNTYQWNTKDFNEVQGGITGNVNMYAKSNVYQTLPLYNNLKTRGNYIYGSDYNIDNKTATITVEAEVRNETDQDKNLTLQVDVVKMDGSLAYSFSQAGVAKAATDKDARFVSMVPQDAYDENPAPTNADTVDVSYINASYAATDMRFWSLDDPYQYTVYTILKDGEEVIDVQKKTTGFRKVEYDINDGGLKINDEAVYLKGYAQRSTNEWATIGVANDWLTDIDMQLIKESNGNYIRWMHVAPKPVAIRATDKYGIVSVCPAGDKEGDTDGRAWDQRVEAMRDAMIYYRNSPSVIFWETGNNAVTPAHSKEMTELKQVLDPKGGRYVGCRTINTQDDIKEAEYVGTMVNRNAQKAKDSMAALDKYMPIIETEYARDEAPRRVWDDYSPPDYDYDNKYLGAGASKTDGYDIWDLTSEDFCLTNARQYEEYYKGRVGGGGSELYTGAAIMVWSDSNMHVRNCGSENCRTSGKVDPVRVKKQAFYALQAVQSDTPKIDIVGHWNYPQLSEDTYWYNLKEFNGTFWEATGKKAQRDPKNKSVYVIGSPGLGKVELYVNDVLVGTDKTPENSFIYEFPNIDVTQSGKVYAIAYDERDQIVAEDQIETAGAPATIELEPVTGPDGLIADGSDIAYYDVKVVDAEGRVCPLNYDRIDFTLSGEGVFLGGYNSGKYGNDSVIHKDYVFAECGENRVFVRSTRNAGKITLTATMQGMSPVSVDLTSVAFDNTNGLSTQMQRSYRADEQPPKVEKKVEAFKSIGSVVKAIFGEGGNTKVVEDVDLTDYYTVKVNEQEVSFGERPYKPDMNTGVVSEVKPVLDALKAAGADLTYTEQKEGTRPDYIEEGSLPIISITTGGKQVDVVNGNTTLIIDQGQEKNLMQAMPELTEAGELKSELLSILGYIPDVTASVDTENKVYNITFGAVKGVYDEINEAQSYAAGQTSMEYQDNKVTVHAGQDIDNAVLVFAAYDNNGTLSAVSSNPGVTIKSGEDAVVDVPAAMQGKDGTVKALLWDSLEGMNALCGAAYISGAQPTPTPTVTAGPVPTPTPTPGPIDEKYQAVQVSNDYNTEPNTDGPDGTGYLKATSTVKLFDNMGQNLKSNAMISLDFRFDDPSATMALRNSGKWGPNFSYDGTEFRTQTASTSYQKLGAISVGKWYSMEIEGMIAVNGAKASFKLYEWQDGQKKLINTVDSLNLRQFSADNNGAAEFFEVNNGLSIDNVKVVSLYASEVEVTAMNNNIKANDSTLIYAIGTRGGVEVAPPKFDMALYDANGNALQDSTVSIDEEGILHTTSATPSQTVTVRATAQTPGNAYGEVQVVIEAADTSADQYDALTLTSDKNYVRVNEPTTITPQATKGGTSVTVTGADVVWSVYNEAGIRKVNDKGITVTDGVVTVTEDVLPQNLTIRGTSPSGSVISVCKLAVKPANMLLNGEEGNKDTFVSANTAEELIIAPGVRFRNSGSWNGSGYYDIISTTYDFVGFESNTNENVLYSADMKFNQEGAGWIVWDQSKGKQGMQVIYKGGKLGVVKDSNTTPTYFDVDQNAWYNVQIMCACGNGDDSYANLIVYKYDENGKKVNPKDGAENVPFIELGIPMRNLSQSTANHIQVQAGTSVDNVLAIKTVPDQIEVSLDKNAIFAGDSVQGSVTASRKGVAYKTISSDLIKWSVYDSDNQYPVDPEKVKVKIDASGKMTTDALVEAQTLYVRASTIDGILYDAKPVQIQSSDVFGIDMIGFNPDYTKVVSLDINKMYFYNDDVSFVVCVYDDSESTLKSVTTKKMKGKDIASGQSTITVNAAMPADFDKDSDVVYVYTVTSVSENEEVTEDDGSIGASWAGDTLSFTKLPAFDASKPVIVMVVKPGTTTTAVKDSDIAYIKQVTGGELDQLQAVNVTGAENGQYIIKIAGKVDGVSTICTGVAEK